jgi:ABC-type multidrug transport system ATPase subunit
MLYQPMRDLSKLTNIASNAASGAERIQEVLDQAPEVIETNSAYHGPQRLQGTISFENVYFGYIKDRPVLKGVSLSIPAGHKVALVGYSGSGKTTLVKLIPRFYEITYGSLKIDGVDIRNYPLQVLRNNISLVLQDSVLFEGTIRENLEIGRPGASLEDIVLAAQKANIHDVINKLPEGYDTIVREQGSNFSAGQRQRLAIARAILRDTPILILDEPTANLDVESEAEVMHALNTLISGRTVFTISHRLSTLGKVDEIIVMSGGNIIEQGTFKYLKQLGGIFTSLLEEQNRYNLDREDETMIVRAASIKTSALNERTRQKVEALQTQEPILDQLAPLSSADLPTSDELVPLMSADLPTSDELVPISSADLSISDQLTMAMPTERLLSDKKPSLSPAERSLAEEITVESPAIKSITSQMTVHMPNAQSYQSSKHRFISNAGLPSEKKILSPDKSRVFIQIDGKPAGEYVLQAPLMKIGRHSDCDIQISSARVSRHHAVLRWNGQGWVIEDADSLNGLTWRGYRINQMALSNGNRVYLDPTIVLQYREDK